MTVLSLPSGCCSSGYSFSQQAGTGACLQSVSVSVSVAASVFVSESESESESESQCDHSLRLVFLFNIPLEPSTMRGVLL